MNTIKQIIAVTLLNLRNLPQRFASSAVAVVGVGAVVLVFAAVLSMAAGLEKTGNCIGGFTFQFSDGWWKFGFDDRENAEK